MEYFVFDAEIADTKFNLSEEIQRILFKPGFVM